MQCDMCGKQGKLFNALVEGSEMVVCKECSRFGKILRPLSKDVHKKVIIKAPEPEEPLEIVVSDYSSLIKSAREKAGLKQEDAAKRLNEKESLLQKVESGKIVPSLRLAKKLESFFHIKLIEEYKKQAAIQKQDKSVGMTIGDLIKI